MLCWLLRRCDGPLDSPTAIRGGDQRDAAADANRPRARSRARADRAFARCPHRRAHAAQAGPSHVEPPYPLFIEGAVVRGFGRGSKDLGCPTANLPDEAIAPFTSRLATGVHYGYARVAFSPDASTAHDRVLPMVMSVGWNPFYKNEKRTLEVHVLDEFPHDFYGHHLRIAILGFIRPEYNYTSMGEWLGAATRRADRLQTR